MLIKCTKCKKEFEQKRNERRCGCSPSTTLERKREYNKTSPHKDYNSYINAQRRYYHDPIWQHYRIFHNEYLNQGKNPWTEQYNNDPYPEN